jgi:hypothetical protein
MYSVCRFVRSSGGDEQTLYDIGSALNRVKAGQFARLDKIGGRFSVSLSTADTWHAHLIAIRGFIHEMSEVISEAIFKGIYVEIDVAVEPEDLAGGVFVSYAMPSVMLTELGARGITMVFTQYK